MHNVMAFGSRAYPGSGDENVNVPGHPSIFTTESDDGVIVSAANFLFSTGPKSLPVGATYPSVQSSHPSGVRDLIQVFVADYGAPLFESVTMFFGHVGTSLSAGVKKFGSPVRAGRSSYYTLTGGTSWDWHRFRE